MSRAALGDVLVYGGSSWDEPWLTEHHLAHALGRTNRVLFVDSPQTPLSPFKAGVQPPALRAAARLAGERLRWAENVHVLTLVALPPASDPRARRLSGPWLRRQVARAVRRLGLRPRVVLASRGVPEGVPGEPRPFLVALVKDWLQAGGHLTGLDPQALRRRELEAWRSADLVCAISSRLQGRLAQEGIDAALLRHGVDAAMAPAYERATAVPQLAGLPRPLLGCAGRIDGRWAFEALGALADRFGGGSLVLIGPVNPRVPRDRLDALLSRPNVHLFPPVTAEELPSWLARLDCSLVPYVADEWQRYASPLKVWDYLCAGVPIAATGSPALGEFPPGLVHFALDPARLADLVARALAEDGNGARATRRRYARENTWDHRAAQLAELIALRRG
jgi:glycosyltransferase involved in cell wall biosynthesis